MLDLVAAISSVDPPSFVAWAVLVFAAGMYPLGLMLGASCSPCCGSPCDIALNELPESIEIDISVLSAPEHYSSSRWINIVGDSGNLISNAREVVQTVHAPEIASSTISLAKQAGHTSTTAAYRYSDNAMNVTVNAATSGATGGSSLMLSISANRIAARTGFIHNTFRDNTLRVYQWAYKISSSCPTPRVTDRPSVGVMPRTTVEQMRTLSGTLSPTEAQVGPSPFEFQGITAFNGCTPTYYQAGVSGVGASASLICPVAATGGGTYREWTFGTQITPSASASGYPIGVSSGASVSFVDVIQRGLNDTISVCISLINTIRDNPGWGDGRLARATWSFSIMNAFDGSMWQGFTHQTYTAGTAQFGACQPPPVGTTNPALLYQQVPYTMIRREAGFGRTLQITGARLLFSGGSVRQIP